MGADRVQKKPHCNSQPARPSASLWQAQLLQFDAFFPQRFAVDVEAFDVHYAFLFVSSPAFPFIFIVEELPPGGNHLEHGV